MGNSLGCFRSRLPPLLTTNEIDLIKLKSNLNNEDINQWYSRFIHCYPNGYLNEKEFINYYQQLHDEYSLELKLIIKELFRVFDLNNDQKLDFYEFILFNILTNDGTMEEKFQLIFHLFDKEKEKYFTRNQIKDFLKNIFHLFDIPSSKFNLSDVIDLVFQKNNIQKDEKIQWKVFSDYILNHQDLHEQLISTQTIQNQQIIQRSERF